MPILPLRPDVADTIEFGDEPDVELVDDTDIELSGLDLDVLVEFPSASSLPEQRAHRRVRRGLATDVRGGA